MATIEYDPALIYDYVFCGTGAAASLVLLELERVGLLDNARVLLIDKTTHRTSDKTFCFWEVIDSKIEQQLNPFISHSWENVLLPDGTKTSLAPYKYHHISGRTLHNAIINLADKYQWNNKIGNITEIKPSGQLFHVMVDGQTIIGKHVFDSRTPSYSVPSGSQTHIHQSFIGWRVALESSIEIADSFRIMDFNIPQQGFTQFIYVLPYSPHEALIEMTRFGAELISKQEAHASLEKYILSEFGPFSIIEEEVGCIPMCNSPLSAEPIEGVVRLGALNYSIKPSTGYAFKNMYNDAVKIVSAIQQSKDTCKYNRTYKENSTGRFKFYDSLLLSIIKHTPTFGKPIFLDLFKFNSTSVILKFLDEKTTLKEEISIFSTLPLRPFLKALRRYILHQPWFRPAVLLSLVVLMNFAGALHPAAVAFENAALILGLIAVGIPHGAVDHLVESGGLKTGITVRFILHYLLKMGAMLALWLVFPLLALSIFLIYSAWHFGETDGKMWELKKPISFLWGISAILYIMGTHTAESGAILSSMAQQPISFTCPPLLILLWSIYFFITRRSSAFIITMVLFLSTHLSLTTAFGLYFIGQHSITGWLHLQSHFKKPHKTIWLQALPFHAGAWLLLALFYFFHRTLDIASSSSTLGIFFIFLACISFPHVLVMHSMYKRSTAS